MSTQRTQFDHSIRSNADFSALRDSLDFTVLLSSSYIAIARFVSRQELMVRIADESDIAESMRSGAPIPFEIELDCGRILDGIVSAHVGSNVVGDDGKRYVEVCLYLESAREIDIPTTKPVWLT